MKKIINLILVLALALALCACGAQPYEATEPQEHSSENILTPADLVSSTDSAVTTGSSDIFVNTVYPNRETISVDVRLLVTNEDGTDEFINMKAHAVKWTPDCAEPLLNVINDIPRSCIKEIWIRTNAFHLSFAGCCALSRSDNFNWTCANAFNTSQAKVAWNKFNCFPTHFNVNEREYSYQLIPADNQNEFYYLTFYFMI